MLRITPILGSRWSDRGQAQEPSCTLVEYAGCRILWNIGWCEAVDFPTELPPHDCLIVTDSTLQAVGGLPLYHQRMRETTPDYARPPIYATFPTVKMGQMTLYDQHAAVCLDGKRPAYSLEDLDEVFGEIHSIKYSQSKLVYQAETGQPVLSVTAHRAGHVIGGAFYVLQRLQDETIVVLTSDYSIAKEIHLDSSTLLQFSTPDVLVTHPGGPAFARLHSLAHGTKPVLPSQLVTQAERQLVESILAVLRRDGNVLLPVDPAGRVLELVLLLDQHWERHRLAAAYNLVWLGPMVRNTAEFAASQLEWMAARLGWHFDSSRGHPFRLKQVQLCTSMTELEAVMEKNENPTCVLASGLSLDEGPSRNVLLQWADNPDHAVILTDSSQAYLRRQETTATTLHQATSISENIQGKGPEATVILATTATTVEGVAGEAPDEAAAAQAEDDGGLVGSAITGAMSEWTVAGQLLSAWAHAKAHGTEMEDSVAIDVLVPHRAPLVGAELHAFVANEQAARQEQLQQQEERAMLRQVELAKGQLHLGEEEGATTAAAVETRAVAGRARPRKKSRFDSSLFLKFSKPLHLTFEIREEAVGLGQSDSTAKYGIGESVGRSGEILEDDYGIAVIPERFSDIVSGVDPSKIQGRIGEEVMRRGLGYGVDAKMTKPKKMGTARVSEDEGPDEEEEMEDEQALEAIDLSEGSGIIRGRGGRPPTKVYTVPRRVDVLAEVSYIPLEGRVDAKAARQSVRALQPRQIVILGGTAGDAGTSDGLVDEVRLLAEASATGNKHIQTPCNGETAELEVGHAAYAVRLIDAPYQTREEKESGAEAPEPMEPFEAKLGACTVSLLNSVATGQKVALDGSIVLAPKAKSDQMPSVYVSDGDVLLTDLRSELIALGMKAEYSARKGYAQLVVNGKIVIQKEQDGGRMSIEGPLTEDFYTVRSIVAGQYVCL